MKINIIIAILLVISMLFVQSTYIMAVETQEENIEAIYNDEENTSEKDVLPNSMDCDVKRERCKMQNMCSN